MLSHYQSFNRSRAALLWLLIVFSLILVPLSHSPSPTPVQAQGDLDSVEYDAIRSLNAGATDSSEQTGDTHVQQLTPTGEIAYVYEGDIYLLDLATGDTEQLTDDRPLSGHAEELTGVQLAWTPRGEALAFASVSDGDIFQIRLDNRERTRLTNDPTDEYLPDFAPDGTFFFVRRLPDESSPFSSHVFIRQDTTGTEEVIDEMYPAAWWPRSLRANSQDQLAVTTCGGGGCGLRVLPDDPIGKGGEYSNPPYGFGSGGTWSQSGLYLAFTSHFMPPNAIYIFDTTTREIETIFSHNDKTSFAGAMLSWSPDDQWLAFDYGSETGGLWVIPSQGGEPQQISAVGSNPAWRPAVAPEPTATPEPTDTPEPTATPAATHTSRSTETSQAPSRPSEQNAAGRIVFTSDRDGNDDIYVMNADGTSQNRLTNDPEDDWDPVWSPDGTQIAFLSRRDGSNEIYVMDADGTNLTNVTNNAARDDYPTWSPDGNRIAYISFRDGNWNVYVMNADGSNQARLTNTAALDVALSWSPDGNRIAVSSTRDGNNEIYVMDADGGNQTRLTNNAATDWAPAWSPDSNRIAFSSNRDGNTDIYVMESDGSNQTRLTNDPAVDDDPTWSPDGRHIAFSSARDGNVDIYVMESDGSNQTRLTDAPTNDRRADWGRLSQQALITPSPVPTVRRVPTDMPEPTATRAPTDTPEPTAIPDPTQQPRDTAPTSEATPEISLDQLVELPVPAITQLFDPPDTTKTGQQDYGYFNCAPASTTMVIQHLVNAHQLSDVTSDYPSIRRLFRQHQPDPSSGILPSLVETLLPQLTNNQITAQLNYFAAEHWQESVARQIQAGYPILVIVHNWNLLEGKWSDNRVHAIVLTGIGDSKVIYSDPQDGQRYEMTSADFETAWKYTTFPDGSGNYAGYIFTVQATTAE